MTQLTKKLREPRIAMNLTRLGSLHQTRLSFVRTILRKATAEHWQIDLVKFDINANGYGTAVYQTTTKNGVYSCIIFAQELDDDKRSDRVIAEAWDITFALISGKADKDIVEQLSQSVPLQEAGRNNPRVLVLSRANRSIRNFSYITDCLANGEQPDSKQIAKVGYLYRTTAVYGNGKFGIADYHLLLNNDDFARPFAAQMFAVYLLRDFCVLQVEHIAEQHSNKAVKLAPKLNRYLGIGNSTGLGMAPFLINHPGLISRWVQALETAIARCVTQTVTAENQAQYLNILNKAAQYFSETSTVDTIQQARYEQVSRDIKELQTLLGSDHSGSTWGEVLSNYSEGKQYESTELFNSILLELFPDLVDDLCDKMGDEENYQLNAGISLAEMKALIESRYAWTLAYDFSESEQNYWFWYSSEEKEEPRLGVRGQEPGDDKQMPLGIAWRVQCFYQQIDAFLSEHLGAYLADFLLSYPNKRGIARRIQSMSQYVYPEIHANLFAKDLRPLDLLRAKLAFFGVSKFDPKSDKWVRVTMFQGAPTLAELSQAKAFADDWYFPLAPTLTADKTAADTSSADKISEE